MNNTSSAWKAAQIAYRKARTAYTRAKHQEKTRILTEIAAYNRTARAKAKPGAIIKLYEPVYPWRYDVGGRALPQARSGYIIMGRAGWYESRRGARYELDSLRKAAEDQARARENIKKQRDAERAAKAKAKAKAKRKQQLIRKLLTTMPGRQRTIATALVKELNVS